MVGMSNPVLFRPGLLHNSCKEDINHHKIAQIAVRFCKENLNDLHHDPLPIGLMACLICLAQVESHPLGVLLRDLFHNVQGSLAQSLV